MAALLGFSSALDTSKWARTIALLGALVVVSYVIKLVRGIRAVGSLPGFYSPFAPCSVPGTALPLTWWNHNLAFIWKWRKNQNIYHRFGRDTVSFVTFLHGPPTIFTRSLEVAKQVLSSGGMDAFDKYPAPASPFSFWGPNIIDAYGDHWRKYRKISSPAFNNDTFAAVWAASSKLFAEMVTAQDWASKDVVDVPSVDFIAFKYTLTIFTSTGFGVPWTWSRPPSQGDELTVQECLEIIVQKYVLTAIFPSWAWKLPFGWVQRTRRPFDFMRTFMQSQISSMRATMRSEAANGGTKPNNDLFSLLTYASENEGHKKGLSDKELIGNVFTFLYAGYDTTAHALAATLALLALDSDIQDELAAQVREVTEGRDDDTLLYGDYGKLDKVLAAFYEAIRMFPPGPIVPREAKRDIVLNISDTDEPKMLVVKKGTHVVLDIVGVHYHPKYYSDPEVYRPSRWYAQKQDQSSDAKEGAKDFTGFGLGFRSCIGRKYASIEAVAFLAHLLRDWRVEPLLALRANGQVESVDQWRERVLQAEIKLTLGIDDYSIRFVRRK